MIGELRFKRRPDEGDLDAPVVADSRSPGSQVPRRVALELWAKTGSHHKFAVALGKRLGRVVGRKAARTIVGKLTPEAPDKSK